MRVTLSNSAGGEHGVLKGAPNDSFLIGPDDRVLITGAAGFIGSRVLENLIDRGFRNLVCFVRPSSDMARLEAMTQRLPRGAQMEVHKGNLLSRADCDAACEDVTVIFHLAAGIGEKSFADAFMNSVVATRNLLESWRRHGRPRRFALISSFSVYNNRQRCRKLDESCPLEEHPELRGDAYCYAKVKQEQILTEYGSNFELPYVVVRPGSVYGAGNPEISGRVGIATFGLFVHLGGSNTIPLTYVDNCAEAIVLAGLVKGVDGEVFNIVDDALPSSRTFLRQYKKHVRRFRSVYMPHWASYALCSLWEKYSRWSYGQLPPAFNRSRWRADWKKTTYSNDKLKRLLGWRSVVSTEEALNRYFAACRGDKRHA